MVYKLTQDLSTIITADCFTKAIKMIEEIEKASDKFYNYIVNKLNITNSCNDCSHSIFIKNKKSSPIIRLSDITIKKQITSKSDNIQIKLGEDKLYLLVSNNNRLEVTKENMLITSVNKDYILNFYICFLYVYQKYKTKNLSDLFLRFENESTKR